MATAQIAYAHLFCSSAGTPTMVAEWLKGCAHAASTYRTAVRSLMHRGERPDAPWTEEEAVERVTEAFFKVQWAWALQDADLASNWMSVACYRKHSRLAEALRTRGHNNVRADIALIEARIVDVHARRDDHEDGFWALIASSMIDYEVEDATGRVLRGAPDHAVECTELWRLLRRQDRCVVDAIRSVGPGMARAMPMLPEHAASASSYLLERRQQLPRTARA